MMSLLTWVGPAARMQAGLFFVPVQKKGRDVPDGCPSPVTYYSNTGRKKLRS